MTPLLFWKLIGYGILILFGVGIAVSVLGAVAAILMPIAIPFLFLAFYTLSIVTYPVTLLLRACGYSSKSFFTFGCEKYDAWKEARERTAYRRSQQERGRQAYKDSEYREYDKPKLQPTKEPQKPSPWEILGVKKGASKDEIGAAFRQKMMSNHPDKVANLDPELQQYATKRTILIKDAYEELIKA